MSASKLPNRAEAGSLDRRVRSGCAVEAHDYEAAVQRGRATWTCPKCGQDISVAYLLWWEAVHGAATPNEKKVSDGWSVA